MTRHILLVWDAAVQFSELPGHWWLPLAGAVLFLVSAYYLVAVCVEGGRSITEGWLKPSTAPADLALRRAQLQVAARIGRRR